MAGDYQHYLQQMLQRGFTRLGSSKKHPSVWEYRKSEPPLTPTRIAKLGAEDHFYSPNSNGLFKSLDDKITEWEAHRQADVRRWRKFDDGQSVDATKASKLIGLTAVRTRAVRNVFTSLFDGFLGGLSDTLQNPDVLFSHLSEQTGLLGLKLKKEMMEHIGDVPIDPNTGEPMMREIDAVGRMITYSVSEHFSIEVARRFREISTLFDDLFKEGPFNVEKTHNEALETMLDDTNEREDLISLEWQVRCRKVGEPWVLPDCAVMNISKAGNITPFLFGGKDERAAIILPLSPDRMLLGKAANAGEFDFSNLDEQAAKCSSEFFVASERSQRLDELCKVIGEGAQKELDEGLSGTLSAIDPFLTKPTNKTRTLQPIKGLTVSSYGINTTEGEFSPIAQALGNIIVASSRQLHLDQIRQVIICHNVHQAVLERRAVDIEALGKLDFEAAFYKLPIEDEDGIGFELYVNGWAFGFLLRPDDESHDFWMNLFLQALWQIHSRAILFEGAKDFSETRELYKADDISEQLCELAISAALKYVAARHADLIEELGDEVRQQMCEDFLIDLEAWDEAELPLEGTDEERNTICETLFSATENLFISAVRYLGVCQAQNIDALDDIKSSERLEALIEAHSLTDWVHRLDVDLLILFANFEKPFEKKKVTALTAHIERLYWGRGSIIVAEGEGSFILPFTQRSVSYATLHAEIGAYASQFLPDDFKAVVKKSVTEALSGSKA